MRTAGRELAGSPAHSGAASGQRGPLGLQAGTANCPRQPTAGARREDHGSVTDSGRDGLLAGLFDRGGAPTGDAAWLQAMLDAEAALARALERAGLAAQGSGAAVT